MISLEKLIYYIIQNYRYYKQYAKLNDNGKLDKYVTAVVDRLMEYSQVIYMARGYSALDINLAELRKRLYFRVERAFQHPRKKFCVHKFSNIAWNVIDQLKHVLIPMLPKKKVVEVPWNIVKEIKEDVLLMLRFTGKDYEQAVKLVDVICRYGVYTKAPKYIIDAVSVLMRYVIIKRIGKVRYVSSGALQKIINLLW